MSIKKITVGQRLIEFAERTKVLSTTVEIDGVWRRKTALQAYGSNFCSHHDKTTWEYVDCPKEGCILFTLVAIGKRIILDLLKVAQKKSKFKDSPLRFNKGKAAGCFWRREMAIYLLFVFQKTRFLSIRPDHLDNILYQCGYAKNLSLEKLLGVTEAEALDKLPFWIIVPRMTQSQLNSYVRTQGIEVPTKCSKTRDSLCKLVLKTYSEWHKVLSDEATTIPDIISTIDYIDDWKDASHAKEMMRRKLNLLDPGDESLIMWLTTNADGFCPILKKTPGPHTHKMLLSS